MNVKGKVTPRLRARIEALFDAGHGVRAIARALAEEMEDPPARSTIGDVLRGRVRPEGAEASRPGPGVSLGVPASLDPGAEVDPDAPRAVAMRTQVDPNVPEEAPRVRVPVLPDDATPSAIAIWSRMRSVGRKIDELEPLVSAGTYPPTQWAALIKVETQLAKELADHIPPPPPDPAKDPTNVAARAMVHAQVVRSIEAAASRVGMVCFRCRGEVGS